MTAASAKKAAVWCFCAATCLGVLSVGVLISSNIIPAAMRCVDSCNSDGLACVGALACACECDGGPANASQPAVSLGLGEEECSGLKEALTEHYKATMFDALHDHFHHGHHSHHDHGPDQNHHRHQDHTAEQAGERHWRTDGRHGEADDDHHRGWGGEGDDADEDRRRRLAAHEPGDGGDNDPRAHRGWSGSDGSSHEPWRLWADAEHDGDDHGWEQRARLARARLQAATARAQGVCALQLSADPTAMAACPDFRAAGAAATQQPSGQARFERARARAPGFDACAAQHAECLATVPATCVDKRAAGAAAALAALGALCASLGVVMLLASCWAGRARGVARARAYARALREAHRAEQACCSVAAGRAARCDRAASVAPWHRMAQEADEEIPVAKAVPAYPGCEKPVTTGW